MQAQDRLRETHDLTDHVRLIGCCTTDATETRSGRQRSINLSTDVDAAHLARVRIHHNILVVISVALVLDLQLRDADDLHLIELSRQLAQLADTTEAPGLATLQLGNHQSLERLDGVVEQFFHERASFCCCCFFSWRTSSRISCEIETRRRFAS